MSASNHPMRQRAEQLAATLPPLLVTAERVASTVAQGVHGRRRVGQGETFWQFRQYAAGDRPESIDWRQSAKSDRVFVRQTEWEAAQSIWLWRDTSASMSWRSADNLPTKRARAELLCLALAALLVRGGEHIALLGSSRRPSTGRSALRRMALGFERPDAAPGDETPGEGADAKLNLPPAVPLPRHGHVVLIGDFWAPLDDIERAVRGFAESGARGLILQVLDPAEESLPYEGRMRFEGLEGESPWILSRVESVRHDYETRVRAQRLGLREIARAFGWRFIHHHTNRPPHVALLEMYAALSDGSRRMHRL